MSVKRRTELQEDRGPWFNRAKKVIRIEEFLNDVLVCSLNSAPAEILPRCPILFPCFCLDSRSGSWLFCSVNSQILNHLLNSYQLLPLPPTFQLSLRSELERGCAHKEFVFSCALLPSSCSDASFCAPGLDHKHLISGQGLHYVSRIPPLLHCHQPSVMWAWAKSVGCFVLWSPRASSRSTKHPLPARWGLNLAGTNSCSVPLSVYKCWWTAVALQISLQTNSSNSNVCWKTMERTELGWAGSSVCLILCKYRRGPFSIVFSANFQLYT